MRYDDSARSTYTGGEAHEPLHLSGAPLPSITLIRPMELEDSEPNERGVRDWSWGWLCCIHAARGKNSFSHFYGTIRDLGKFQQEFLESPEETLAHYFKWKGLDAIRTSGEGAVNKGTIEEDLFA